MVEVAEQQEEGTLLGMEQEKSSWYSEDYADLVKQQGWKDPNDPVRDYSELLKSSSQKIKIPGEDATDEQRSAFYAKIRGVEKPDEYAVEAPEDVPVDEGLINKLRQWAFETGVPKAAFETVIKNYFDELSTQRAQSRVEGENTLKAEWKNDYGKNLEVAKRFAKEAGGEFLQFLDDTGLGNHPVMVKAMHQFGLKTLSDSLIKGEPVDKSEDSYRPSYPNSPEQYQNDTSEEGQRARAWFKANGLDKGLF